MRALAGLLLVLGVFPLANLLTGGRAVPWFGGAAGEWGVNGLVVFAVAWLISYALGDRLETQMARARGRLLRPSQAAFGGAVAAVAFVAAAFVSWWAFEGQPFTSDEMAQQFHARVIASGHLAAQAEPLREFFNTAPVFDRGAWFSQYPVGGPAVIALGVLVGAPWLVNPVLLAVTAVLLHRALARVADEFVARAAAILFVASPMVLVMAGSQMNHVATLAFATLALWAVLEWDVAATSMRQLQTAAVTGVALGLIALVRPLDAALVGACVAGFQALRAWSEPSRWRSLVVQCVAGAVPVAVLLWANARTTGSPLLFGYEALNGAGHGLGFHVDPTGDEHTPLRGLILTSGYLMRLSLYLFEWPLPGVLVIAAGLAALRQPTRRDVLLAALLASFLVGYAAYWFDGFFAGPRFLFTAVPAFVYFAVRAPDMVAGGSAARGAAQLVLPLCLLMAWLGPWGVSSAPSRIALYRDQRTKLKTDVAAQLARERVANALVFVHEGWRGTLLARLRVLDASQFRAERVLNTVDACALQTALDREDASSDADSVRLQRAIARARALGVPRAVPNLPADQAIALVPGSSPTPVCLAEFSRDSIGTMPYAVFLAKQTFGADGRVGGPVVFVRDMGARNERLRSRFGDRAWYRYRPARSLDDTSRIFLPYTRAR